MTSAMEFLDRAFTFKDGGWLLLTVMAGATNLMIFYWIQHWPFRIVSWPCVVVAAAIGNVVVSDLGLHVTSDTVVNYAMGFGIGIFAAVMVLCTAAWTWYEVLDA